MINQRNPILSGGGKLLPSLMVVLYLVVMHYSLSHTHRVSKTFAPTSVATLFPDSTVGDNGKFGGRARIRPTLPPAH